ncbi:putative glycolipid-binding domain-containing protein, partial [Bacillus sp. SIMBA_031]
KGFKYIDISLTPFTNTLPIHHLKLQENNPQEIDVIYIDVLNHHIKPAQQRYTRTAANKYLYENIQTYFKAEILVDENGLVVTYPDLFEKIG